LAQSNLYTIGRRMAAIQCIQSQVDAPETQDDYNKERSPFEPGITLQEWIESIDDEVSNRTKTEARSKSSLPISSPFVGSSATMPKSPRKQHLIMKWKGSVASKPCWMLKKPTPPTNKRTNQNDSSSGLVLVSRPASKDRFRPSPSPPSTANSSWDPAVRGMKTYPMSQSGTRRQSFFSLACESPLEQERRLKHQDHLHQSTMFSARGIEASQTFLPEITRKPVFGNDVNLYSTKPFQSKLTRSQKILLHPQPVRPGRGLKKAILQCGSLQASKNCIAQKKRSKKGLMKKFEKVESGRPLPWNANYEELMKKTVSEGHYAPEYKERRAASMVAKSYPNAHSPVEPAPRRPNVPSSPGYYTLDDEISAVTDGFSHIPSPPMSEPPDQSRPFSSSNLFQQTRLKGGVKTKEMARNLDIMEATSKTLGASFRQAYFLRKRQIDLGLMDPNASAGSSMAGGPTNDTWASNKTAASPGLTPSQSWQEKYAAALPDDLFSDEVTEGFIGVAVNVDWKSRKLHDMTEVKRAREEILYPAVTQIDFQVVGKAHRLVKKLLKTVGDDLAWPESEREAFVASRSEFTMVNFAELVSKLGLLLSLHSKLHEALGVIQQREILLNTCDNANSSTKDIDSKLESLTMLLRETLPHLHSSLNWLSAIIYDGVDYIELIESCCQS